MLSNRVVCLALLGAPLLLFGCGSEPPVDPFLSGQVGTRLVINTQPGGASAGIPFTTQPVVGIYDAGGTPVLSDNRTVVTATIASGGGSLLGSATATASSGVVTFSTLGIGGPVGNYTLSFSAGGLTSATSDPIPLAPGAGAQLRIENGDSQTAGAGTTLPEPLAVRVLDDYDNGVSGISIAWGVLSGGGSVSSATTTTDQNGAASVSFTLGPVGGTQTVAATTSGLGAAGLTSVTFSATSRAGATIVGSVNILPTNNPLAPPQIASSGEFAPWPVAGRPQTPSVTARSRPPASQTAQYAQPPATFHAPPEYVSDELLVTYHPAPLAAAPIGSMALAAPETAEAVASSIRASLVPHMQTGRFQIAGVSPVILTASIRVADPTQLEEIAEELRADPTVAAVGRNHVARLDGRAGAPVPAAALLPNDALYPWQAWHYRMIDAPHAWSITTGNTSVLVAVVDDGIRFDHPGIAANLTSDGYDFVRDGDSVNLCGVGNVGRTGDLDGIDADPSLPLSLVVDMAANCWRPNPSGNHGLHVAGTIGAVGNDISGGTGVNWRVAIRPVRVGGIDGSVDEYEVAQGVLYAAGLPADNGAGGTVTPAGGGARIINMSLGFIGSPATLEAAVISATNAGALIVAAAGNAGNTDPNYPAAYPQTVSVSAVGPTGQRAWYSSYGSTVDITAPGGDFPSGNFNPTFGIYSTVWDYTSGPKWDGSTWEGTSMAAPHVAGVAALLLAREPGLTAAQIRARLLDYAVDIGPPGRDDQYGHGLVNARNSLTQSLEPPQQLYVSLVDANTGAVMQTVSAASGSYSFFEVTDGLYHVYAGQDADGDRRLGTPNRRWGAFGGSARPDVVTVNGVGSFQASFDIGRPAEAEPNDTFADANVLAVGGWVAGLFPTANFNDPDVYRVQIPTDGLYTFEVTAFSGACGFALDVDPLIQLYDGSGSLLMENRAIDPNAWNFCSKITSTLTAGTYHVAVWGHTVGLYAVTGRAGS